MSVVLPEYVDDTEEIARIICDKKSIKNSIVSHTAFLDTRNPTELSVNRITTLNTHARHDLGKQHQEKTNQNELIMDTHKYR